MEATPDELTARLIELEARQRSLDAERAALVAVWSREQAWALDGSATAPARLARETGISRREARERVRVATLLEHSMPHTLAAFDELGWSKVRLLANAIDDRTAAAFERHEESLVAEARRLSVDHLAILMGHWRRLVDADGANADADSMHDSQFLQIAESFGGEGFLKGRLDPETTAIVKGALNEIADELYRSQRRELFEARLRGEDPAPLPRPSHRLALALREMAKRARAATAAEADGRASAPARPLVIVNIDVDIFGETMKLVRARLANGAPLSLADAERLACDAAVTRVLTRDGAVPLHLGRTSRDPSEAQRRALGAIWAGCAFPGCDRPFAWCELHHVWHWEHGGPTDVDWLLPLCDHHHTAHHRGVFRIHRRPDSTFHFERADGRPIGDANPTMTQLFRGIRDLTLDWAA